MRPATARRLLLAAALAATTAVAAAAAGIWHFMQVRRDMSRALEACACCEDPAP
ncbi:hypothetical protein SAMN02745121_03978 [Nannocystis exedens]|uniref:Uncharacterized protein n=1 Tax=Nannocystis exedens TaxID=54 RepID=A0A1I1ZV45_9BACT|nr:hypothetical protein [Nannocystis exedens]PCC75299.1 hypothetical protein NAEX_08408 [Nannocystis exedens]SFE35499.1 hypothetical protein SAMN02745121_03978 [Nannocystis exedens]